MKNHSTALSACLAAAALTIAGCSGSSSPSVPGTTASPVNTAHSAASAAASSSAATQSGPVTGTQLAAALQATASKVGRIDTSVEPSVDSGSSLETAATRKLSGRSCLQLFVGARETGYGESAMASADVNDSAAGGLVRLSVYQFGSAASAGTFFSAMQSQLSACDKTGGGSDGTGGSFAFADGVAPPGIADDASFAVDLSDAVGGSQLAIGEMLVARAGTDVYVVAPAVLEPMPDINTELPDLLTSMMTHVAAAGSASS